MTPSHLGREPKGLKGLVAGPESVRLLLVEDDPFQADAIKALCESCGYHAMVASSATEAMGAPLR